MSIDIDPGNPHRIVTTQELPDLLEGDHAPDEYEGRVGLYLETGHGDGLILLADNYTALADELEETVKRLRRFAREVGE